jgi:hypothetical protein
MGGKDEIYRSIFPVAGRIGSFWGGGEWWVAEDAPLRLTLKAYDNADKSQTVDNEGEGTIAKLRVARRI